MITSLDHDIIRLLDSLITTSSDHEIITIDNLQGTESSDTDKHDHRNDDHDLYDGSHDHLSVAILPQVILPQSPSCPSSPPSSSRCQP